MDNEQRRAIVDAAMRVAYSRLTGKVGKSARAVLAVICADVMAKRKHLVTPIGQQYISNELEFGRNRNRADRAISLLIAEKIIADVTKAGTPGSPERRAFHRAGGCTSYKIRDLRAQVGGLPPCPLGDLTTVHGAPPQRCMGTVHGNGAWGTVATVHGSGAQGVDTPVKCTPKGVHSGGNCCEAGSDDAGASSSPCQPGPENQGEGNDGDGIAIAQQQPNCTSAEAITSDGEAIAPQQEPHTLAQASDELCSPELRSSSSAKPHDSHSLAQAGHNHNTEVDVDDDDYCPAPVPGVGAVIGWTFTGQQVNDFPYEGKLYRPLEVVVARQARPAQPYSTLVFDGATGRRIEVINTLDVFMVPWDQIIPDVFPPPSLSPPSSAPPPRGATVAHTTPRI